MLRWEPRQWHWGRECEASIGNVSTRQAALSALQSGEKQHNAGTQSSQRHESYSTPLPPLSGNCRLTSSPPELTWAPIDIPRKSEVMHGSIFCDTTWVIWYKRQHLGATYENQRDFPQPLIAMQHLMHLTLIFLAGDNNISYEICRLLPNSQILAAKPKEGADRAGKMRSNLMQMFCRAPQAPWLGMSKKFKCSVFSIMENWLLLIVYKVF